MDIVFLRKNYKCNTSMRFQWNFKAS